MKSKLSFFASFLGILLIIVVTISCQNKKSETKQESAAPVVINENLRFCEATYPYEGGILIGSFGTDQLNPLNNEGKGYIAYYEDGKSEILIPADGTLSAPKGMYTRDKYLFVCDVNKVVVYNLDSLTTTPQIIHFPEEDLFVNDLVAQGNTLYVSVTNTGRVYSIDISNLDKLEQAVPVKWVDIAGPNGLIIDNAAMYVASYPADGNTTEANVVYVIPDITNPVPEKFITTPGQYDGIALSEDGKSMYVTDWSPAIHSIDMETRKMTLLVVGKEMVGPADISVVGNQMYIPDLPNSQVICISIDN
ncbi:hypothetical protein [Bacteroides sp.]|uniref:hypothetical protein n=1 Tax=Bacteroides sp. TaxID=29523 RepID=UPI002615311E|nr:hypothetical protein [Bacteroides sp.]